MHVIFVNLQRVSGGNLNETTHWRVVTYSTSAFERPFVKVNVRDDLRASIPLHIVRDILISSVKFTPQVIESTGFGHALYCGPDMHKSARIELTPQYQVNDSESVHMVEHIGDVEIDGDTVPIMVKYQYDDKPARGKIQSIKDHNDKLWFTSVLLEVSTLRGCFVQAQTRATALMGYGIPSESVKVISEKIAQFMDTLPLTPTT